MCKHILNAQVQIRAQCCKKWYDCAECHAEAQDHQVLKANEIVLGCKKCKKVFRKNIVEWDETDEYCPRCDNHFLLPAVTKEDKVTEQFMKEVENQLEEEKMGLKMQDITKRGVFF